MHINNFDWNNLKFFIAVAEERSLLKAAKKLDTEHSTVARRISQLEKDLNQHLFHRSRNGMKLTEIGQQLLQTAKEVEAQVENFDLERRHLSQKQTVVCVSAPPQILQYLILPKISAFQKKHPEIRLNLLGSADVARLSSAEIDLAIRMSDLKENGLMAKKIYTVTYSFYENSDKNRNESYIGLGDNFPQAELRQRMKDFHKHENPSLILHDFAAIKEAISCGLGIGILPDFMGLNAALKKRRPLEFRLKNENAYIVYRKDSSKNPQIRMVKDFLIELFQDIS